MFLVLISLDITIRHREIVVFSLVSCINFKKLFVLFSFFSPSFFTGATFTDWFTSYVNNVVSGGFPIIRDQIFRYFTWGFLEWNDYKSEKNISYRS